MTFRPLPAEKMREEDKTGTIRERTSEDHCARNGEIICKDWPSRQTALARHGTRGNPGSQM